MLFSGSVLSSACYAATIRAGLGLGPLFVLQDGIARHLHVSIGASVTLTGLALIGLAMTVRWRPGPGTLALPFIGGAAVNALLPHVPAIAGLPTRIATVVVATLLMGLSGALMVRAAIGFAAYDGIMIGLHRSFGWRLSPVRLTMESTVLAVGCMLGGAVGLGTVVTGVLIGPAMQFWLRIVGVSIHGTESKEDARGRVRALPRS